jgi:hypothetical protein
MGIFVTIGSGEEGAAVFAADGNSVAGTQAARIARQIKTMETFFMRLFCHK